MLLYFSDVVDDTDFSRSSSMAFPSVTKMTFKKLMKLSCFAMLEEFGLFHIVLKDFDTDSFIAFMKVSIWFINYFLNKN